MVLFRKLMTIVRRIAECPISKCLLLRGKREQGCSECERNIFLRGGVLLLLLKLLFCLLKKKEAKG